MNYAQILQLLTQQRPALIALLLDKGCSQADANAIAAELLHEHPDRYAGSNALDALAGDVFDGIKSHIRGTVGKIVPTDILWLFSDVRQPFRDRAHAAAETALGALTQRTVSSSLLDQIAAALGASASPDSASAESIPPAEPAAVPTAE